MSRESEPWAPVGPRSPSLPLAATQRLAERCEQRERRGLPVYRLGVGASPFPVPALLSEALRAQADRNAYLPAAGLPALKEAIAAYLGRREGLERDPESVLVGPGLKPLLFLLRLTFRGEILLPSPSWPPLAAHARILGRPLRLLPTSQEEGWMLSPSSLAEALDREEASPGSRMLILSYPSNPTGATFRPDQLEELAAVARKRGLRILSDEVYGELHHKGQHQSIARYHPLGTIVATGLSSWCGAGGWRLGALSFPPSLADLAADMRAAASEIWTSASAPIQHAAVVAFGEDPSLHRYLANTRRVLSTLARWCARRLRTVGLSCPQPMGGFYLLLGFSSFRERLKERGIEGSEALAEALLQETGVALLPGTELGMEPGELCLRMAYVDFDGARALHAVDVIPREQPLDEIFLKRHCRPVVEATRRLCAWAHALGPPPEPSA